MSLTYWPCDPSIPVTSGFGWRGAVYSSDGTLVSSPSLHDGTDFGCFDGTPVYAAHDGYARTLSDPGLGHYGIYVQIDSDDGVMTQYGHIQESVINDGWVKAGTQIALSGHNGGVDPHLHFRLHVDGNPTDPLPELLQNAVWYPLGNYVPGIFVPTTNQGRVVRWMLDNTPWTVAGIAGVCGNIEQESSYNPLITEDSRPFDQLDRYRAGATAAGFGLCQWSFDDEVINGEFASGRLWGAKGLLAWAKYWSLDYTTIDTQMRFAVHEIESYWPDLGERLSTATDPYVAAKDFGYVFEGFNPLYEGPRNDYAVAIYPRILSGEFGPVGKQTTTTPTPTASAEFPLAAVLHRQPLEDDNTMEIIDLVGPVPSDGKGNDLWRTWIYSCGELRRLFGTEFSVTGGTGYVRYNMSWGDFRPALVGFLSSRERQLDSSPRADWDRLRYASLVTYLKEHGVDPVETARTDIQYA